MFLYWPKYSHLMTFHTQQRSQALAQGTNNGFQNVTVIAGRLTFVLIP